MSNYQNNNTIEPEISMIADFEGDETTLFVPKVDRVIPILALRDQIIFPGIIMPVQIGRQASVKVVKFCHENNHQLGILAQKDPNVNDPEPQDFYEYGTLVRIVKVLTMPDGKTTAILQGQNRFHVDSFVPRPKKNTFWSACVSPLVDAGIKNTSKEFTTLVSTCREMSDNLMQEYSDGKSDIAFALRNISNNLFFINFCCTNLPFPMEEKISMLQEDILIDRAYALLKNMNKAYH